MKVICTQENLKKGMSITGHLSSRNVMLPILNNVLLKTQGGALELVSTNLEIGIKTTVRCRIEEDGSITAPARLLSDYVALLPNENLELASRGLNLELKTKDHLSKLKGLPADDFPLVPALDEKEKVQIPVGDLKKAIACSLFASSQDTTRPEINGLFLKKDQGSLSFVATDSFRLSEFTFSSSSGPASFSFIVPARTMYEVSRVLGYYDDTEVVQMGFDETQVLFQIGETQVLSRLIEGKYPEYKQIIPERFGSELAIKNSDLIQAIKLNSLFSKGGVNDVVVEISNAGMKISSNNQQVGENIVTIPVENYSEDYKIVFNFKYLLDGLEVFGSDASMVMKVVTPQSPILFTSSNLSNLIYLVMPIKA